MLEFNHALTSRRDMTKKRRQLSAHQRQHATMLASLWLHKLTSRLPRQAKVGMYYDGFGELPTQPLLSWCQRHGFVAYLPLVGTFGKDFGRIGKQQSHANHCPALPYSHVCYHRLDKCLRFAPVVSSNLAHIATYRHPLGMKQQHSRHLTNVYQLDVLFCPLVAVDSLGVRMGMGGGYYDTTLAKTYRLRLPKPLLVGWCYDFQLVQSLTKQPWDVPMHAVITPNGLHWF